MDQAESLDNLTMVVHRAVRAPAFIVSIVGGQLPAIASSAGMPDRDEAEVHALLTSLCLGVATHRETLIIRDIAEQGPALGLASLEQLGARSCLCFPLRLDGWRIRGLLSVVDGKPRDWSGEALSFVSDIAQIAAMQLRVGAGMEAVNPDPRQLEVRRSVIEGFLAGEARGAGVDGLLASLGTALDWDVTSIWLSDGPDRLRCVGGWSGIDVSPQHLAPLWSDQEPVDERDLLARVLSHQQPVWIPDLEMDTTTQRAADARAAGLGSALWFPLRSSGALGAVELMSVKRRADGERMPMLESSLGQLIGSLLGLDWRVAGVGEPQHPIPLP